MKGVEKILGAGAAIHVGFGHTVALARVVGIFRPDGLPLKRLRDQAEGRERLVDVTRGRATRAILLTDSNHVILSAIAPETLWRRAGQAQEEPEP